ncbi:hypothetical protein GCM10027594_00490 [Hymenobacter agri]|uniref:DUF3945 domain-containing protein n=1 Tax=Hymenobacter jeollabukensis TaxID=2025313 RepID=A0A5R8WIP8_9BACT|nr:DUF3945 domain-containing protein [Hymenobacter jeollabukensis]TLM88504.1 DUF3945 domain-containing protein [Hymenobacter jeollabukensis]
MAEQAENPTPAPTSPSIRYVSSVPTSNGNISGQDVTDQAEHYSLYQLQINPDNPSQGALLPAPGADGKLAASFNDVLAPAYQINGLPKPGQDFIKVDKPTMVELIEGNWKIIDMGRLRFSDTPVPALNVFCEAAPQAREQAAQTVEAEGLASVVANTQGSTRTEAAADLGVVANQAEQGPDAGKAAYADELRDKSQALPSESTVVQQPQAATAAVPGATDAPTVDPVGEVQIQWKQKGDEVAPLMEMRAYLDQLKDAGVAVGTMKMERGEDGKLTGSFGVSYDPESNKLAQLEGILQGFKQVGNGLEVVEKPAQAAARRQEVGYDDDYEPTRSKQVKEAFGAKQWDALSANLADVPKTALTVPEQMQQSAGEKRVEQLAEQQGKTKEQVLKEGKSIFDIDTSGNPASAFLKNFYQHLTGNPKTRQTLEVDYDKTRQELQARLLKRAGSAQLDQGVEQIKQAPQGNVLPGPGAPAVAGASAAAPGTEAAPEQSAPAKAPALFQASDVPQKVLASLGLSTADLEQNGQLQKLLNGQKTDLLPMQVAGKDGEEVVKFEGKMVLHREADGTATLKLELPQEKLVIPNEIGGQPFTPEQRQKLETEGNAGLIRGLKDEKGQEYNGYVAVDKAMNKVVILPENKVTLHETIAGVKLTPEQSHDLKEGKAVDLANMASGDGGRKFDGTVQVNAAKACIEIRPAAHELQQRQAPRVEQTAPGARPAATVETTRVEAPKVTKRAPRL